MCALSREVIAVYIETMAEDGQRVVAPGGMLGVCCLDWQADAGRGARSARRASHLHRGGRGIEFSRTHQVGEHQNHPSFRFGRTYGHE